MALVAYDNSDSSEFEDDELEISPVESVTKVPEPESIITKTVDNVAVEETTTKLFNLLPQPSRKKVTVAEEDDEFLHKKETAPNIPKPKARITVPSLNDFKDVESIPIKPKQPSEKKSGLLSMLPQPKNSFGSTTTTSKSLIPHVLTKKPVEKKPLPSPAKILKVNAAPSSSKSIAIDYSDDSDNDDEMPNDFFSINKPEVPLEDITITDTSAPVSVENVKTATSNQRLPASIQSYFKKDEVETHAELQPEGSGEQYESELSDTSSSYYATSYNEAQASSASDLPLDEEAIRQLCGSRGKRNREEIQIVDVNQQEVLAEAREMLFKGLMDDTTTRVSASKKKGNDFTNQQRKKHQITYLAHQAKANEAELQNQWANNRMSKKQTQSKYGF